MSPKVWKMGANGVNGGEVICTWSWFGGWILNFLLVEMYKYIEDYTIYKGQPAVD
jgi:hypothetical protein